MLIFKSVLKYCSALLMFQLTFDCFANGGFVDQVSRPDLSVVEDLIAENAIVGFSWVDQPINKILLIKNGKHSCAIKYSSYSRLNDKRKSTVFRSGDETFFASADYMLMPNKRIKHLELKKSPLYGIGKLAYSPSNDSIRCGRAELFWSYPTGTFLWSDDVDTRLSPTSLQSFDEINFSDPDLEWFGYEEDRKIKIIKFK